jgi:hypothetical protein
MKPVAGAVAQISRVAPAFARDFGPTLFSRGAFDLAKRVRREFAQVEFQALSRLLTESEKQKLGL